MTILDKLRKDGFRIRVTHYRNYELFQVLTEDSLVTIDQLVPLSDVPRYSIPKEYHKHASSKGGRTTVEITTPDGREFIGTAICSNKENFNKKLSLKIALGRALSYL